MTSHPTPKRSSRPARAPTHRPSTHPITGVQQAFPFPCCSTRPLLSPETIPLFQPHPRVRARPGSLPPSLSALLHPTRGHFHKSGGLTFSLPFSPVICKAAGDEGRGSCGLSLMPLAMPGLWYGRPFSLACSALETRRVLGHFLGSPQSHNFAFRAGRLGLTTPEILFQTDDPPLRRPPTTSSP